MKTRHPTRAPGTDAEQSAAIPGHGAVVASDASSPTDLPSVDLTDEQALIREARRRQRRRQLFVTALVIVVLGVGLGVGLSLRGPAPKAPSPPRVSTTPTSVPTQVLSPGTPVSVTSISLVSFVDDLHGFAVVGPANQPTELHQLASTSDGGRTWRAVGAATPEEPATGPAFEDQQQGSFTFTSKTTGYEVACCDSQGASAIYRTVDGGLHWNVLNPSASNGTVTLERPLLVATYSTSIWALGASSCSPPAATQPVCHMNVFASDDRGTIWTTLPLPVDLHAIFAVTRSSPQDAAIVGGTTTSNTGPTQLLTTTNDGSSWSVSGGPPCTQGSPTALVVVGSEDLALCQGPPSSAPYEFWATPDAGKTWTLRSGTKAFPSSATANGAVGIEVTANGGTLWAALQQNTLYRSDDGGITWRTSGVDVRGALGGGQVTFVDPAHGWLIYSGVGFWQTDDGGKTWRPVLVGTS
jgi:photosystem II stability/assembly factor-like uncharacterized protein